MINHMEQFFKKRILPALTFPDPEKAVSVAKNILEGGINVIEVCFRTSSAEESIRNIRNETSDLYIGAGTIITTKQVEVAKKAGAQFGLAPGFNPEIVKAAMANDLPFIPGVSSPSEIEIALEMGCKIQKLFPVELLGGIAMLKSLWGPYNHTGIKFIPTGGISLKNMNDFLELPNVLAIGGSWLTSKHLIEKQEFLKIKANVIKAINKSKQIYKDS